MSWGFLCFGSKTVLKLKLSLYIALSHTQNAQTGTPEGKCQVIFSKEEQIIRAF